MQLVTLLWLDINQQTQWSHFRVVDGADPAPIIEQMQAISGAAIIEWAVGTSQMTTATPSGDLYSSARDTAGLRFCTAANHCTDLHVRAPNLGIFTPSSTQVDSSAVNALVSACLGTLTDNGGDVVTSYRGGWRGGPVVDAG